MSKQTNYLHVKGMYCSACVTRIEKVISRMDGVTDVHMNLTTETGKVTFDKKETSLLKIIEKINHIGFHAKQMVQNKQSSRRKEKQREIRALQWKFICSAILTVPLAWGMFAHFTWNTFIYVPPLLTNPFFQLMITVPIQFIIGFQFYERAWYAIKNKSTNMDVLVVLSTTAAFFYSHFLTFTSLTSIHSQKQLVLYYETSAFIITFILLGKLLEAKTKWQTTEALEKLYKLQTKVATIYENGVEFQMPVGYLLPGHIVIVKPGERIPIDGEIIDGYSMIDESLLTGESLPVEKMVGTYVYAGTINQNGVLKVKVTKRESETTLSAIINIVEEAQSSKPSIQQIADKITGIFIPFVIMISILTFGLWYIYILPGVFNSAFEQVITVLIIACPCALGLATPTSIMVGSGRAAELGILFKEGKFLEILGKCTYVILDKTGTITAGTPHVTDMYVYQFSRQHFLQYIGAVEQRSNHPVARAIVNKAREEVHLIPSVTNVQNFPGYGIRAIVDKVEVTIASPSYYKKHNKVIPEKENKLINILEKQGKTVMIVFISNQYAGIVAVFDQIKPSAIHAISQLKKYGIYVHLLTGDHKYSGRAVAKKVGIDSIYTECTPSDKATIIQRIQHNGNYVAMVGDGINDAPALAVADVGVAIGTGSDIAIEAGDITIIKGDLTRLADAITISKQTMLNIKQNFLWAFLYNVIMIPFAMAGLLVPWLAGAAMAFSSVSVVLNSLRLKYIKI